MNNDDSKPLASNQGLISKYFDPMGFLLGTGSAAIGRFTFYPIEAVSISMQAGKAKTVKEAIKQNIDRRNIAKTYKGGTSLVKSAILSSGAYYGLGSALMNPHKNEPILAQAAWGLATVLPEQISVVESTKAARARVDLSCDNISRKGWARINTGFFLRHTYGNPATFAAVKTIEKLFEDVVPKNYHPASSFCAGAAGVWLTHRSGYSFLVAFSVQLMVSPEQSFKSAWKNAAKENYIKAGDIRAAGRMGTAAIAFCIPKIFERFFGNDKPTPSKPTATASASHASLFSKSDVKKAVASEIEVNLSTTSRKI